MGMSPCVQDLGADTIALSSKNKTKAAVKIQSRIRGKQARAKASTRRPAATLETMQQFCSHCVERYGDLDSAFRSMDINASGFLDKNEFEAAVVSTLSFGDKVVAQSIWVRLDADKAGESRDMLSREEFVKLLKPQDLGNYDDSFEDSAEASDPADNAGKESAGAPADPGDPYADAFEEH